MICIHTFSTSAGTPFKTYLPKYERLVTITMHGDTCYLPRQDIVINAFMKTVWAQYPSVAAKAFQQPCASSKALASFADLWSRLAAHDRGTHVTNAVVQSHPSTTAPAHKPRTANPQLCSARGHVSNIHPLISGATNICLSKFDSWLASGLG